ncbi:glycoside hydrolase family 31 protein [Dinghuibacter silviterrae]|uniref:Alpha-glucosidase n=1 Tax=Dinghuibacter silviterrae TaxID=1539049 RepID=A0A4R8DRI7_9BACT|nr:TIM-barrel domain-containing protein [Dinghuibacter silviterrae]TDX00814.1 alpha-glucosidase [Dinghuibacter silviterrae]
MKRPTLSGLLLLLLTYASAQTPVAVGPVSSVSVDNQTVRVSTSNARAEISAYGPGIIRVRVVPGNTLGPYFSYAVTGTPETTRVKVTSSGADVRIVTDSLQVCVSKQPFAVTFLTPSGDTINTDEPGLGTSWIGSDITTYKHLQEGERFVGLGEKTGDLDRRGSGYTNWNRDVYGYQVTEDPLYSSIPFYIGIHHALTYGIFFDNSYETRFNFGASNNRFSSFGARGGEMSYYFIYHTGVPGILRDYTYLTGRMPLPPLWSLGYQQNRYSYFPDTEVIRIAQTLREKRIPSDGVTLDILYMDAYKLFTWNKERFPDPAGMIHRLHDLRFHLTTIVDPGIKVEKGYAAYESGLSSGVFLRYPDGTNYTAKVWPGWCHFPDFTSSKGRSWWSSQIKGLSDQGIEGIWNDMNEISTWGQQVPDNVLYDFDGHPTTTLQGHNVYALEMVRSSYDGASASGKRPFILTRSGFAGLQRYSAIWTGDNRSEENHFFTGVRMLASLGLSGVAFTGMDVGGFTGNPTPNLFARWMETGAFIPYYRNHTALNTRSSEPWTYGEDVLDISRNYVGLRYRLLPYLYSTFYTASQDGVPVLRSLAIDWPFDGQVYSPAYENQYLFGPSLLVAPVGADAAFASVYLPSGRWYSLYTDSVLSGSFVTPLALDRLPVYVRGGAIIPMQSLVQSTSEAPSDTLWIHVYNGPAPGAFTYYEDDGATFAYRNGAFYKREIRFDPAARTITLDAPEGSLASKFRYMQLVLHGFGGLQQIIADGTALVARDTTYAILPPTARVNAQADDAPPAPEFCRVKVVTIGNDHRQIKLGY